MNPDVVWIFMWGILVNDFNQIVQILTAFTIAVAIVTAFVSIVNNKS